MDDIVLSLAKVLNSHNILWGVGGSYLLRIYGIVEQVHDLDIIIAPKDIAKAVQVLDSIAQRKAIPVKKEYKTKYFYVYSYGGLSIDVMSRFRIEHSEGVYEFVMDELSIVEHKNIDGTLVPLMSLEDWLIAYTLMKGRSSKVKMIEKYLISHGIGHRDLLERILDQRLPAQVQIYINKLLD
jgi:hypothetical protein